MIHRDHRQEHSADREKVPFCYPNHCSFRLAKRSFVSRLLRLWIPMFICKSFCQLCCSSLSSNVIKFCGIWNGSKESWLRPDEHTCTELATQRWWVPILLKQWIDPPPPHSFWCSPLSPRGIDLSSSICFELFWTVLWENSTIIWCQQATWMFLRATNQFWGHLSKTLPSSFKGGKTRESQLTLVIIFFFPDWLKSQHVCSDRM